MSQPEKICYNCKHFAFLSEYQDKPVEELREMGSTAIGVCYKNKFDVHARNVFDASFKHYSGCKDDFNSEEVIQKWNNTKVVRFGNE